MNIVEYKKIIADADAAIEAQTPAEQHSAEMLSVGGVDVSAIISVGIIVLTAVKALLFWKPKWQTAIANVITWMQTFEVLVP
jgi:hypothetical protein